MPNQCKTEKLARKRSLAVVATLALLLFPGWTGVAPIVSAGGSGVPSPPSQPSVSSCASPTVSAGGSGVLLLSRSGSPAPQSEELTSQVEAAAQSGLAPESIVVGSPSVDLTGGCSAGATGTPLPTSLCSRRVEVVDANLTTRIAPLFSICPNRVVFQLPAGTANGSATIAVRNIGTGTIVAEGSNFISSVVPAIYTRDEIGSSPCIVSTGQGIAKGQLLRVNKSTGAQTYENLSDFGNNLDFATFDYYLVLYGTGFRRRSNPLNASLTVRGISVGVTFAGAQGTFVGMDQVNSGILPSSLDNSSFVNIVFTVDNISANVVQARFL